MKIKPSYSANKYRGVLRQLSTIGRGAIQYLGPAECPVSFRESLRQSWQKHHQRKPLAEILYQRSLKWELHNEITTSYKPHAVCWVDNNHLAVCVYGHIEIHQVTPDGRTCLTSTLDAYQWRGLARGVAVTTCMSDQVFVIYEYNTYLYAIELDGYNQERKFQIHDGNVDPWCISAKSSNTLVVGLDGSSVVVFELPSFHQRFVRLEFEPLDLCISTEYLIIMGRDGCIVAPLYNLDRVLCTLRYPKGWKIRGVAISSDSKHVYIAAHENMEDKVKDSKGALFKFKFQCFGGSEKDRDWEISTSLDLCKVPYGGLSVSKNGWLAVAQYHNYKVKVFSPTSL